MASRFQPTLTQKYLGDPHPPTHTLTSSQRPPDSPAVSQQSKSKILSSTVCLLGLKCALLYSQSIFFLGVARRNKNHSIPPVPSSQPHPCRRAELQIHCLSPFDDPTNSSISMSPPPPPLLSPPLVVYWGKHSQRFGVSAAFALEGRCPIFTQLRIRTYNGFLPRKGCGWR